MGFFKTILSKLGIGDSAAAPVPDTGTGTGTASASAPPATASASNPATTPAGTAAGSSAAAQPPTPIDTVDVVAQLEKRAAGNPQKLNWRTSIVDLLKLLDIDSSLNARKELATELGCPANLMSDSAQMNMWLHKEVLKRIAQNGGNIPAELLT